MKPHHRLLKPLFLTISALLLLIFAQRCMQTVTPANPTTRTLTVLARLAPDGALIPGVTIDVAEERSGEKFNTAVTNSEGAAILRLENIPVLGRNIVVSARRSGQEQRISALLCNDTTITLLFSNQSPATATCARLGGVDSLRFRTNTLPVSDSLIQNEPTGIGEYERCWSFVNSGSDTVLLPLSAQIRTSPPFHLVAASINGRSLSINADTLRVPPTSGVLSLCYAVSTALAGDFTSEVPLPLLCKSGERGIFRLRLRALVVARTCECISSETSVSISERVPVGGTHESGNIAVYTNQLSCPVTVNLIGIRTAQSGQQAEWSLIEPLGSSFPQTLAPGARLAVRLRFAPRSISSQTERLLLEVRPQGIQNACTVAVRLNGQVCRNDCPLLLTQTASIPFVELPSMPSGVQELLSSRLDGNIFVAVPELGMMTSVVRTYSVLNPSTSCTVVDVNITPTFSDGYSSRFFTLSPRTLRILPGERGFFQVSFTPPDAATFAMILNDPARRTGTIADSSFSVGIELNTGTCVQRLWLSARVSNVPDISPILNLRAYRQRTRLKPQEENEVYIFGEQSRRILRLPNGLPGLFPPPLGDVYVDVTNNDSSARPPQTPTLHPVPSGRVSGIALWRENYAEQDFDNVTQTFRAYLVSPVAAFSTGGVRPLPGQVYAFRLGVGSVALLYVRRVDNGTETNTNGQSGVEFRAIYPIVGR